jgi:hypothetical protein
MIININNGVVKCVLRKQMKAPAGANRKQAILGSEPPILDRDLPPSQNRTLDSASLKDIKFMYAL